MGQGPVSPDRSFVYGNRYTSPNGCMTVIYDKYLITKLHVLNQYLGLVNLWNKLDSSLKPFFQSLNWFSYHFMLFVFFSFSCGNLFFIYDPVDNNYNDNNFSWYKNCIN